VSCHLAGTACFAHVLFVFFFQAEDGIRDWSVTGVQTCALPIWSSMLMEQLDYNLLFRWFVGLSMDDRIWDPTVFTKNRERLLQGDIARAFFERVLAQAKAQQLLSTEHFTVDGTLIEAWAGLKSFK